MQFPFKTNPKKDSRKVSLSFIRLTSLEEKEVLLDFLIHKGYQLMSEKMRDDNIVRAIAMPAIGLGVIGYGNIYVMAEQMYHGAKVYDTLDGFMTESIQ
ncbi:MAG: hypothetical protein RBQ70_01180 [Acholeplasma sp.]|jgi:hypothetical protein|nr:hypothetical protein [Acholeplasma sp.]